MTDAEFIEDFITGRFAHITPEDKERIEQEGKFELFQLTVIHDLKSKNSGAAYAVSISGLALVDGLTQFFNARPELVAPFMMAIGNSAAQQQATPNNHNTDKTVN